MDFPGMAVLGFFTTDALTGLAYSIIKILAYGAMGIVFAGIVLTCWCDILECRKLRRCQGRSEAWQLIH